MNFRGQWGYRDWNDMGWGEVELDTGGSGVGMELLIC